MLPLNLPAIEQQIAEGWIRKFKHPHYDLWGYDYTTRAQFAKHWTVETTACRGLILDAAGDVVARPFNKFFNYAEQMPAPGAILTDIVEKLDGSLGVVYPVPDLPGLNIATRGSFTSAQAAWATAALHTLLTTWPGETRAHFEAVAREWTLLFEIIYPENRVVVNYGERRALVLTGARHAQNGGEMREAELDALAASWGFPRPRAWNVADFADLNALLRYAKTLSVNEEGFILRFSDGLRLKLKGDSYVQLHRALSGLSPRRVIESLATDTYPEMIELLPDEFMQEAEAWAKQARAEAAAQLAFLNHYLARHAELSQKDFALRAQADLPPHQRSWAFALRAGRDVLPVIYKYLADQQSPIAPFGIGE